jgi:DNA invertase Pin-like site-specific DNA recombinase
MAALPGPDFRWGIVLRKSKLNADGIEESTDRQEMELVYHIRQNNMGVIVQTYKDIASGWKPGAPRPRYKHALVDLASGTIDGIAVLCIDRLTRRRDQVRPILNALEELGGRLFLCGMSWTPPTTTPRALPNCACTSWLRVQGERPEEPRSVTNW